jgi:hypothetical protein
MKRAIHSGVPFFVVWALGLSGCQVNSATEACGAQLVGGYFPVGVLRSGDGGGEEFAGDWYGSQLRAMAEPPLPCSSGSEVYRFTWLRTFHHPIAVRVEVSADGARGEVSAIELDGAGGYEPGATLRRFSGELDAASVDQLRNKFSTAGFWSMAPAEERLGRDGAEWILEANGDQGYHLAVRWSPKSGATRDLGLHLLGLTGWNISEDETY